MVDGGASSASVPVPEAGTYRVAVFAVQGGDASAASHPTEPVDVGIASSGGTSVAFVDAPEEGGYTRSSVEISFEATPEDATTQCIVDGASRPCRSPLRLGGLDPGSHTIQVEASSSSATVSTPMIAWTVDDDAPTAELEPLAAMMRRGSQPLRYGGDDEGGSDVAGYDVRVRRAAASGEFATEPLSRDETSDKVRESALNVAPGETACVSIRAVDGVGNKSGWTGESCTTREVDQSALHKSGDWERVRGKSYSGGDALKAASDGAALTYALDRTSKVRILAVRCQRCGKLAVEVNGRRRKVIDLGKTNRKRATVTSFDARWIRGRDGRLRLEALGGGAVIVDGIAAWRTGGCALCDAGEAEE
jgi:hypothetical protein